MGTNPIYYILPMDILSLSLISYCTYTLGAFTPGIDLSPPPVAIASWLAVLAL